MATANAEVIPFESQAESTAHEFTAEATGLLAVAEAYEIDSPEMYQCAAGELSKIKWKYKAINEARLSITRPMDHAKARVMDFFDKPLKPLKIAEQIIKNHMIQWDREQDRIRREAEKEAREKLEADQRKAARDAEVANKLADEARADGNEEAAEEAEAMAQEAADKAEILEYAPAPVIAPTTPHVSTVSRRKKWSGEVVDLMALVKAIAEGKAPITLIKADNTAINGMARSLKEAFKVPGLKAVSEDIIASK